MIILKNYHDRMLTHQVSLKFEATHPSMCCDFMCKKLPTCNYHVFPTTSHEKQPNWMGLPQIYLPPPQILQWQLEWKVVALLYTYVCMCCL